MLRLFLILLLMTSQALAANQWRSGTGELTLLGSSNAADIDTNTQNKVVIPLDNLLANYRQGLNINYDSASQLTVTSGSVTVSNADGSIRLMLKNDNSTTVTWADIDTGAEASATTYYIYAIAASASSTSATFKISASSASPSGITYYKRIGYFLNDSSSNITDIHNDNGRSETGTWASKSVGVSYQALTDGIVVGSGQQLTGGTGTMTGYTDGASSPTTVRTQINILNTVGSSYAYSFPVKKGDYYKVTAGTYWSNDYLYFLPTGQ